MLLLSISQSKKELNCVLLFVVLTLIGNVTTTETKSNATSNVEAVNRTLPVLVPEQKSVKKELKFNMTDEAIEQITPPNEKDEHAEKLVIIDEKSVIETSGKALEQQTGQKAFEKTGIVEATTKSASKEQEHFKQPVDEEFVLNDPDDISDSLKTGFYFFLILSSGAIVFIIFKIYRLRLSRAERKYGVQGDRSTQELTPLPISIEDGHSDDEDQTLFEVQRQNIRIL